MERKVGSNKCISTTDLNSATIELKKGNENHKTNRALDTQRRRI